MGAESWSDSALSWRVHRAHPLFIPTLLRSSTVPSRGITGLRGGSSPCLSARRGSSCPGLARSPLQGHELGMASPVLHGRLGGGRPSHRRGLGPAQKLPFAERAVQGKAHGTQWRDSWPQSVLLQGPWCPLPWPAARDSWVEAGQSRKKHPRRAQPRGSSKGRSTLQANFVSITAGEIGLSCESQRWANLMLLDKEYPFWKG